MGQRFPLSYVLEWPLAFLWPRTTGLGGFRHPIPPPAPLTPGVRVLCFGDLAGQPGDRVPQVGPRLAARVAQADCVIVNGESPILGQGRNPRAGHRLLRHDMPADYLAAVLEALGCPKGSVVFNLANNHILDHGWKGFLSTLRACEQLGLEPLGVHQEGQPPLKVLEVRGLRLGLSSWTHWLNRHLPGHRPPLTNDPEVAATAWGTPLREQQLDALVGLPHWDREFHHAPQASTRRFARHLAAKGFHALIGCHPHVLQPVEMVEDTLCAYSLGGLVGPSLPGARWPTNLGAMVELVYGQNASGAWRLETFEICPLLQVREGGVLRVGLLEEMQPFRDIAYWRRAHLVLGESLGVEGRRMLPREGHPTHTHAPSSFTCGETPGMG